MCLCYSQRLTLCLYICSRCLLQFWLLAFSFKFLAQYMSTPFVYQSGSGFLDFICFSCISIIMCLALCEQATKVWDESTVARIMKLTEEAQSSRPKLERWLDEFTERYSQAVVAMSVVVAALGPVVFKWPFFSSPGWSVFLLFLVVCIF